MAGVFARPPPPFTPTPDAIPPTCGRFPGWGGDLRPFSSLPPTIPTVPCPSPIGPPPNRSRRDGCSAYLRTVLPRPTDSARRSRAHNGGGATKQATGRWHGRYPRSNAAAQLQSSHGFAPTPARSTAGCLLLRTNSVLMPQFTHLLGGSMQPPVAASRRDTTRPRREPEKRVTTINYRLTASYPWAVSRARSVRALTHPIPSRLTQGHALHWPGWASPSPEVCGGYAWVYPPSTSTASTFEHRAHLGRRAGGPSRPSSERKG
ncbi:hypothetical protein C8Q77DRAFT_499692 [Trametes polyzona]|nr:hypothetical protein C8Q77DRAFT_499692 [Trametes polyzona]